MTDEQIVLARRAVACEGWRWMPGMLAHAPDSGVEARVQKVDGEVLEVCLPDWYGVTWLAHRVVPDLTDPATLGCLLALVREAWEADFVDVVCEQANDLDYAIDIIERGEHRREGSE